MLKITHIAHSCFLIENGLERLIIDPLDDSFGRPIRNEVVNYLLISHDHFDHNHTENIKVVENEGTFTIKKYSCFHDEENGKKRGPNIIHVIETEGTIICHLGDLGHTLTEAQARQIGHIDILLIPVGGVFTIDYEHAIEVVNRLNPTIVIPMHYRTEYWGEDKGVDLVYKFLDNIKKYTVVKLNENYIEYKKSDEKIVYVI